LVLLAGQSSAGNVIKNKISLFRDGDVLVFQTCLRAGTACERFKPLSKAENINVQLPKPSITPEQLCDYLLGFNPTLN
jgi:hypothetical protein